MDIYETFIAVMQRKKRGNNLNKDNYQPEIYRKESHQSRILEIERAEKAKKAELILSLQKRYTLQKTNSKAVMERLGLAIQHEPSPPPSAPPRRKPELRERRIRTMEEDMSDHQMLEEEGRFFDSKLCVGSQFAVLSEHITQVTATDRSPSPDCESLSSVDTNTPNELRALSQIGHFTSSSPPTPPTKRPSCIPVMSRKLGGAVKEVADGCKLQTYQCKGLVKGIVERVENCQFIDRPSPQPPPAPRRTPAPPSQVASPNKRRLRHRTLTVKPKVPAPPPTPAPPNKGGPRRGRKVNATTDFAGQEYIKSLDHPKESLSLCFQQISSDDWEKKMDGLKSVVALAQHHPELLQTELHEVCVAVTEEVNNLRSAVACAAMDTVAQLHVHLGRAMDPEAEWTGRNLLLKLAQTTNAFIHQQANVALDALVQGCSTGRALNALLNTGLSHRCVAVRESTARHLYQLANIVGEERILTAGKTFTERFLNAVSMMAVDPAQEVRLQGQQMLQALASQKGFMILSNKVIPEKTMQSLQKILKKMRQ